MEVRGLVAKATCASRSNFVLIPCEASTPPSAGHGGKGIRTPGLLIANETLYQLSYTP
jgi:hypothetical protein